MRGLFNPFGLIRTRRTVRARPVRAKPVEQRPRDGLSTIASFGGNPGALRMKLFLPPGLQLGRPIIVVLHGCGQSAVTFAADAGWVALANHYKVALVLPEQTSSNNHGRCFNWFLRDDIRPKGGEAASIRQMVLKAAKLLQSDRKRIFVTGFSAGGGMAAALIAAYPAMFAAAAVFAGMPVGSASTAIGALLHMRNANTFRSRGMLAADVLQVTGAVARKRWPRVSIWHGEEDHTVHPANAEVLAAQWSALHGLAAEPSSDETTSGVRRRFWGRVGQMPAVELCTLSNIGHGFPIDRRNGRGGRAGAWVTDAGVSGPDCAAAFFRLRR